jgi:hypothetical protein
MQTRFHSRRFGVPHAAGKLNPERSAGIGAVPTNLRGCGQGGTLARSRSACEEGDPTRRRLPRLGVDQAILSNRNGMLITSHLFTRQAPLGPTVLSCASR